MSTLRRAGPVRRDRTRVVSSRLPAPPQLTLEAHLVACHGPTACYQEQAADSTDRG